MKSMLMSKVVQLKVGISRLALLHSKLKLPARISTDEREANRYFKFIKKKLYKQLINNNSERHGFVTA